MQQKLRVCMLFALGLLLQACASQPEIRSDYDRSADFSQYKTYNFISDAGPGGAEYASFFTQYMIEAITIEMEKRGYTKSDNPDLLVNFSARLQDVTKVREVPAPYYGYRGGYYSPWGAYGYATETHVSQYTEGTVNIDLVDAKQRQLVWEAVAIGRITDDVRENLRQRIMEAVPKFFEKYPFSVGSAVPMVFPE